MARKNWSVQDAKNRFSEVLNAAKATPQTVTKHGKPTAVVVAADEYERLKQADRLNAVSFNDHLLAMPRDDGAFERLQGRLRETDL